jgi:hypothetical protein
MNRVVRVALTIVLIAAGTMWQASPAKTGGRVATMSPITAVFDQAKNQTTYTANMDPGCPNPADCPVIYTWQRQGPVCGTFTQTDNTAVWSYPPANCSGFTPPHPSTITVTATDGLFDCMASYNGGSQSGTGPAGSCTAPPPGCQMSQGSLWVWPRGEDILLRRMGDSFDVLFGGSQTPDPSCGGATTSSVTSMWIWGAPEDDRFDIDLSGGPFTAQSGIAIPLILDGLGGKNTLNVVGGPSSDTSMEFIDEDYLSWRATLKPSFQTTPLAEIEATSIGTFYVDGGGGTFNMELLDSNDGINVTDQCPDREVYFGASYAIGPPGGAPVTTVCPENLTNSAADAAGGADVFKIGMTPYTGAPLIDLGGGAGTDTGSLSGTLSQPRRYYIGARFIFLALQGAAQQDDAFAINLNGDIDELVEIVGTAIEKWNVIGGSKGDVISADGGKGTGDPFPFPATLKGGGGKDKLTGGLAKDKLIGGAATDTCTRHKGDNDVVKSCERVVTKRHR